MITVFNRKQLIITYDMDMQIKTREILENNNIDYVVNPVTFTYNFRQPEYRIYVKKSDYEQAEYLIRDVSE